MTDIARPCNPALSFSSFTDEAVSYHRSTMKAYPDRIEILSPSPRTTIPSEDLSVTEDDGRSKSAPPNPSGTHEVACDSVQDLLVMPSTYDPRCIVRPDSAPPVSRTLSPNDRRTGSEKNRTRNPELGVLHVLRTPNAGATSLRSTTPLTKPFENPSNNRNNNTRFVLYEESPNAEDEDDEDSLETSSIAHQSSFSQFQGKEQEGQQNSTGTIDGRQLNYPIAQTPSRLSALFPEAAATTTPKEHRGGGTLILRPNPLKAAEIIITTNLSSPADLVRAAVTASPEEQQLSDKELPQHGADEGTTPKFSPLQQKTTTTTATEEEKKASETWKTAQARQAAETEAKRMLKEAQQQRKQEFQVNFPENTNATFAMPYASGDEERLSGNNNHSHSRNEAARTRHSQQQQQNHRDRMNSLRASSGAESLGNNRHRTSEDMQHPEVRAAVQPTPLFERLVTEEVQELKTYAGIVERQNVELAKQKKVQEDLEARLRAETRRRKELESLLEEQERLWSEKFAELELERNAAEKKLLDEETKTKKLINQVQRKDRDIHDFFKKKYDHDGGRSIRSSVRGGFGAQSERTPQPSTASAARSADFPQQSPHQILSEYGTDEKVREGNAKNLLLDFFGI